jgi:hypothetical protein
VPAGNFLFGISQIPVNINLDTLDISFVFRKYLIVASCGKAVTREFYIATSCITLIGVMKYGFVR